MSAVPGKWNAEAMIAAAFVEFLIGNSIAVYAFTIGACLVSLIRAVAAYIVEEVRS